MPPEGHARLRSTFIRTNAPIRRAVAPRVTAYIAPIETELPKKEILQSMPLKTMSFRDLKAEFGEIRAPYGIKGDSEVK